MASNPLEFPDVRTITETGTHVMITCREPYPCLSGRLHGSSAVIHAAMEKLEAIHQAAHALREEP